MRSGFAAWTQIVSVMFPPITVTRTSCTPIPPALVVARTPVPRENRKYHSTQTMATAPNAVTMIWVGVMGLALAHLHARARSRCRPADGGFDAHGVERAPHEDQ